jgi:hypothetical protein
MILLVMLLSLPEWAKPSGARKHPGWLRRCGEFPRKGTQTAAPLSRHQKKNGPVKMSRPGRLVLNFRIYLFGLFGA